MASDGFFDFVFRKERGYGKNPYTVRGYVVVNKPSGTSGMSKPYVAVAEVIKTADEAEFLIKAMERELYGLRKKARDSFEKLARDQKKSDEVAAEAAAYIAKKEAEKAEKDAAEAAEKKKKAAERDERRRND